MAQNSTHSSLRRKHDWLGLSCRVFDVRWDGTPGWMSVSFEQPVLCFLIEEIGGRGELRMQPESPSEGEYFGNGHLTLLAAKVPIVLHSSTLRQAQFACLPLRPHEATCLTPDEAERIMRAPGRLMFRDSRLHACAMMLSAYEGDEEHDAYGLGLRHALLAALVGVAHEAVPGPAIRLTGRPLARVFDHINEHLDERVTNDSLAQFAELSPIEFGAAFREATGLSPQRWQMDARVRSAQRLMVDKPTLSLSSVAVQSGFADQSHFSRAFLDILGITPTAWLHQRR